MNRPRAAFAAWVMLAGTAVAAGLDAAGGGAPAAVAVLAGATALACESGRRHGQHGLMAMLVMLAVLAPFFAPAAAPARGWSVPLLAFALLVGSRAVVRAVLGGRPAAGWMALGGSSVIFGMHALVRSWWREGAWWLGPDTPAWLLWAAVSGAGAVAQLAATPWLVKTIPGAREDPRPALALWGLLLVWMVGTAAR